MTHRETCSCGAEYNGSAALVSVNAWRRDHRHEPPQRPAVAGLGHQLGDLATITAFALGPDDVLVIDGAAFADLDADAWRDIRLELDEVLGDGRWLILHGDEPSLPDPAAEASPEAEEDAERLPWHYYAPELRTRLKGAASVHGARVVAEVAASIVAGEDLPVVGTPEAFDIVHALCRRFDPSNVADAAAELARLVAEHGPRVDAELERLEAEERRR